MVKTKNPSDAEIGKWLAKELNSPPDAQTLRDLGMPEEIVAMEVKWGRAVESRPGKSLGIWLLVWVVLALCVVATVGAVWAIWGRG